MYTENSLTATRSLRTATGEEAGLGPLKGLVGTWANIRPAERLEGDPFIGKGTLVGAGKSPFDGRGWNLIALPFAEPGQFRNYRLLLNQYNEVLKFTNVGDDIPNRGITDDRPAKPADQEIAALDYEQTIQQISAADFTASQFAGGPRLPIHHEPGFFLYIKQQRIGGIDIGRLASIPHGNAVTALGISRVIDGPPTIADLTGLPEGATEATIDVEDAVAAATGPTDYLRPYNHFAVNPFKGVLDKTGFPGFEPINANALLQGGLPRNVVKTTVLPFTTTAFEAGIVNIPFIKRQADAAEMTVTFWLMELDDSGGEDAPREVLAYSQHIFLDFFDRRDGKPGRIRWPHISINVMEKIAQPLSGGENGEGDDPTVKKAQAKKAPARKGPAAKAPAKKRGGAKEDD